MKTFILNSQVLFKIPRVHIWMPLVLIGLWFGLPKVIGYLEPTAGLFDAGILQVILLGITCYFVLLFLCGWCLNAFWQVAGLPAFRSMVLQFPNLQLWQQLGFYWASFALLLLAAVACLAAVF